MHVLRIENSLSAVGTYGRQYRLCLPIVAAGPVNPAGRKAAIRDRANYFTVIKPMPPSLARFTAARSICSSGSAQGTDIWSQLMPGVWYSFLC